MIKIIPITLLLFFIISDSISQIAEEGKVLRISEVVFDGTYGFKEDSINSYRLIGNFWSDFRNKTTQDNIDYITYWIRDHPRARVIPISATKITEQGRTFNLIYCWLIDKKDTINNDLVRNGHYFIIPMQLPESWDDFVKKEGSTVFIDKRTYEVYLDQLRLAQCTAYKNNLGVWKNVAYWEILKDIGDVEEDSSLCLVTRSVYEQMTLGEVIDSLRTSIMRTAQMRKDGLISRRNFKLLTNQFNSKYANAFHTYPLEVQHSPFGNARIEAWATEFRTFAMPGDGCTGHVYNVYFQDSIIAQHHSNCIDQRLSLEDVKWYMDSVTLTFEAIYDGKSIKEVTHQFPKK